MRKRQWFVIAPISVLVLGMTGFIYGEGYSFYDALLSSLKLLKVELDPLPPNPLLEIARWIGIIFLFGLVYAALLTVIENSRIWRKSRRKDAVAVHGKGIYVEQLAGSLGRRGIHSNSPISFKAPVQVILFETDDKSIDFFQAHSKELQKAKEVHLCLSMGNHISVGSKNTFVVNLSEVKAISYWREHFFTEPATIVIIGSGQLGETVLYWGLLTNIIDLEGNFKYIIFGDFDKFQAMHPTLKDRMDEYGHDTIEFINEKWYRNTEKLVGADRIILCKNTWENIEIANSLSDAGYSADIHLFTDNENVSALINKSKCKVVGTITNHNIEKVLLMDDIHKDGKLCHAAYMLGEKSGNEKMTYSDVSTYIGTEEFLGGFNKLSEGGKQGDKNDVDGWNDMDAFTRGSNYAAAIHDPIKYKLLKSKGIDVKGMDHARNTSSYDDLSPFIQDYLQEIEHIRWSRYHFLNNWNYAEKIIIDGEVKAKDSDRRIHTCLVPYNMLMEKDKKKDSYFYKTLSLRIED